MDIDTIRTRLAQRRAEQLISELAIAAPADIDIEAICMTRGALVIDGGITGAEARLTRSANLSFIRVNTEIREPGRRRFAIAHELGHLLLQPGSSQFSLCTDRDLIPFYTNSADELEASIFAAALLMPAGLFGPLCRAASPSLKHIAELATQFQVTLTAAATRYIEFCPLRCCLVVSTAGKVRYHRSTSDFGYFVPPLEALSAETYAADHFRGEPLPEGMHTVKATSWLEGSRIDSSKTIMEDSLAMPSYNSVLTLLWIDKDIDRYVSGEDEYDEEERESNGRWSWNKYRDRS
jgi:Zn-dependent peptidase ImmA (M78 family)